MKTFLLALMLLLSGCNTETHIRNRVVFLTKSTGGSCSGTQVIAPSGNSYILTAAHCEVLNENGSILAKTDDGRLVPRKILEVSPDTDLMLLEGIVGLVGVAISDVAPKQHDILVTYTHGLGLATYASKDIELIQEQKVFVPIKLVSTQEDIDVCVSKPKYKVQELDMGFFKVSACGLYINSYVTMSSIQPGSSGGGVFNSRGELCAVVFAGANGNSHLSFFVTHKDIEAFMFAY